MIIVITHQSLFQIYWCGQGRSEIIRSGKNRLQLTVGIVT